MASTASSPSFNVFDIGKLVASSLHKSGESKLKTYLPENILFISSPVRRASNAENRRLRDELCITTLLDTQRPDNATYTLSGTPPKVLPIAFWTDRLLGLTLYRVQLRVGRYSQAIIDELPSKSSKAVMAQLIQNTDLDPEMNHQVDLRILARTSVEDSFAVLTQSMHQIKLVFIKVLAKQSSFPLLLAGDGLLRDNSILMFLVLLLLGVPVNVIDDIRSTLLKNIDIDENFRKTDFGSKTCATWLGEQAYWAKSLEFRLKAAYGDITGYLEAVGVTRDEQEKIVRTIQSSSIGGEDLPEAPPAYEESLI